MPVYGAKEKTMTEPTIYLPNFLSKEEADRHLTAMLAIDWEHRLDAPRKEYWSNDFDQPYTYGKRMGERTYLARPMPISVDRIREEILDKIGVYHQGCFCNRYDGERDWLGWHSDDDPGIDHNDPISVVTLGQSRVIQYRSIPGSESFPNDERTPNGVLLEHGSLFIMTAGMQSKFQHRIPKAGARVGTRISLTYRSLIPPHIGGRNG